MITDRHTQTGTTKAGAVLVTGASSGIGHATARHPKALADLAASGCQTLALDVTDESSIRQQR